MHEMKSLVALLGCAALCLAAPAPQDNVSNLYLQVFGPPNSTTQAPKTANSGGSLDTLINALTSTTVRPSLGPQLEVTTSKPILGTNNQLSKTSDCECVPYYQCRNGTILDNGVGIIDIRLGPKKPDNKNGASKGKCNYLDVCCDPPDRVNKGEPPITPKPKPRTGCGQRNPQGVGFRITGAEDNEAQFGEFPWMVAILTEVGIGAEGKKLNVYQCGGALIHARAVLTAAHCVNGKRPAEIKVRAGEWDTQTKNEVYPHQDRDVQAITIHEKFNSGALYNDVAILILSQPVELTENVDVVCLPEYNEVFDGSRCLASGWGKDVFGKEGNYQVILKKIEVPVVPHDTCQNILRQTRLGKYYVLDPSFICAGGEKGKDTCKGDGGSPLVCPLKNNPTRYAQVGIVAWGIGCGEDGNPGVYANVAAMRRWIDEQVIYYNLDTSSYASHQPL